MSAFNGAHSVRGGFNQSGGAYFIVTGGLDSALDTGAGVGAPAHLHSLVSGGSNSGGAWAPPTLATTSMSSIVGLTPTLANYRFGASTVVTTGALLKDMGRTIVSSGRTFRKFAPVLGGTADRASSLGVIGGVGATPNAGYGSFYLEVGREGLCGAKGPAPIARYF